MAYTALAYSDFTMHMDAKVMPTDDIDYSCHIKPWNIFNQSYRVYITPLIINSLRRADTQIYTHTYTYRHSRAEAILRNQVRAWFKNGIGMKGQKSTQTRTIEIKEMVPKFY